MQWAKKTISRYCPFKMKRRGNVPAVWREAWRPQKGRDGYPGIFWLRHTRTVQGKKDCSLKIIERQVGFYLDFPILDNCRTMYLGTNSARFGTSKSVPFLYCVGIVASVGIFYPFTETEVSDQQRFQQTKENEFLIFSLFLFKLFILKKGKFTLT